MQNLLFKKSLVIGIIVLFIGVSIAPITGLNIEKHFSTNDKATSEENNRYSSINQSEQSDDWWDNNWSYRKKITIDHDMVVGNLQNFPVLIYDVSSDYIAHAQHDGDDFLFVSADNTTKYNHEIENYNSSSGELIIWVNITTLSSSVDTVLYMYYGNPNCGNQQNIHNTWDSGFVAVYHMGESGIVVADSTSNNLDGTKTGPTDPESVDGVVGNQQYFDGDDKITTADNDKWNVGGSLTMECWAKKTSCQYDDSQAFLVHDPISCTYMFYLSSGWEILGLYILTNSGYSACYTSIVYGETNSRYWVGTFDRNLPENRLKLYCNGVLEGQVNGYNENIKNGVGGFSMCSYLDHYCSDSWLDEVRISNVERSQIWITTTYNNQNDSISFLSFGPEIEGNHPPNQPNDPSPEDGETGVSVYATLSWMCSDPDGDDLTYDVYFGKSSNPPLVSTGQSQTFYNPPGVMNYNTHYYWKIVAWDPYGRSTTGPIWDFTTSSEPNEPPELPSNPSPEAGATDVNIDTVLSWNCSDPDGDDLVYDVYFEANDPTPDILVSDDQTEDFYSPGTLKAGTTYYWQIIAKDIHGASTPGPIWYFTTKKESTNKPPNAPIINGPTSGKPYMSYPYIFTSTDPDGDEVSYYIEWGDGDKTIWTEWRPSGPPGYSESHSWNIKGTYIIQAKTQDKYGAESNWTELTVTITKSKNKAINTQFISYLQNFIHDHSNLFPILQKIIQKLGL